ncbi:MAG TPA: dethiobiotin synthase [Acidimicrobiales bacterium]|nr:dethiobiotin synthase [Acidimicrobiales bacterium]
MVLVTGTATEVGKTWVSCALLRLARARGLTVAARKPAQSFEPDSDPSSTDAAWLAAASGSAPDAVCPPERSYPVAMAPPMAAAALGKPVPALDELASWVTASWSRGPVGGCDLGVVEGAGGVASPLAGDGDSAALARALDADRVVLVADPALGVINSVRLSVAALAPRSVVVHLNRFDRDDDLQRRNLAWLQEQDGLAVTTTVEGLLDALCGPDGGRPAR